MTPEPRYTKENPDGSLTCIMHTVMHIPVTKKSKLKIYRCMYCTVEHYLADDGTLKPMTQKPV